MLTIRGFGQVQKDGVELFRKTLIGSLQHRFATMQAEEHGLSNRTLLNFISLSQLSEH